MARSIWEAQTYVSLRLAEREQPPGDQPALTLGDAPPMKLGTNLAEGPDAWTYQSPVGEITIPYVSEKTSVQVGAPFGLGRSRLIDAAEWVQVARLYHDWAIGDMLYYAGEPDPFSFDGPHTERRGYIRLGWDLAIDAILQAMAFLPEGDQGGDQVPDSEIWSQFGARAKAEDPHLVTRARLEDDLETYRGILEDFRNTYDAVD
ncbi:hypothetical protein ACXJJ3_03930 [Kribbella sp. WER1]